MYNFYLSRLKQNFSRGYKLLHVLWNTLYVNIFKDTSQYLDYLIFNFKFENPDIYTAELHMLQRNSFLISLSSTVIYTSQMKEGSSYSNWSSQVGWKLLCNRSFWRRLWVVNLRFYFLIVIVLLSKDWLGSLLFFSCPFSSKCMDSSLRATLFHTKRWRLYDRPSGNLL